MPVFRGWVDEEREHLHLLDEEGRVNWFEKRINLVVLKPLSNILHTQIATSEHGSALLIWGVSVCAAIEACGKFLCGLPSPYNNQRFKRFLDGYLPIFALHTLPPRFTNPALFYKDVLWEHFRNGIAHGFAVSHGGFHGSHSDPYFAEKEIAGRTCLLINPVHFWGDFCNGVSHYLAEVRDPRLAEQRGYSEWSKLRKNFNDVFKHVFIDGK